MATEPSETHSHRAKDGLYYETYEEMRNANVLVNQRHLARLGLAQPPPWKTTTKSSNDDELEKRKNKKKKRRRSTAVNVEPTRRSARTVMPRRASMMTVKDATTSSVAGGGGTKSSVTNETAASILPPEKKSRMASVKKQMDDWESVSDEIRRAHANNVDKKWFGQFKKYWESQTKQGLITMGNYKETVRRVEKLYLGEGISTKGWPEGVCFRGDQPVDMSTDFEELYKLADQYKEQYGDKSHGKLMHIPIRKLSIFQRHYFEKELGKSFKPQPSFAIGTQFKKTFPGHGTFVGVIESFNGVVYRIKYPEDGDVEDMLEDEVRKWVDVSLQKEEKEEQEPQMFEPKKPRYAVGTKFVKPFPGFGLYVGQIESFDGYRYQVFYPKDDDREELDEIELDGLKILPNE